jgi:tripartite-type tricarboxylate transporter receptor subunit TctC
MDRRGFVVGSAAAAAALAAGSGHAQDAYPSRPITVVNPFPPGGAVDVVGRPFAAVLEPLVKQAVVIETKAGAAGQVGAQYVASAKPDGYTLLAHIVSISGFPEVDKLFGRAPKFTRADFIPIARFTEGPMVLVVNDKQPYKTLKELVDDAKKRRTDHLQLLGSLRRAAPADGAVREGRRHPDAALADRRRRAGPDRHPRQQFAGAGVVDRSRQRSDEAANCALACFSSKRAAATPDVPTLKELGYDVEFSLWVGLFAPKGTPAPVIAKLRTESKKAVESAQFKKAIENIGDVVAYLDQPDFAKFWDADAKRVEAAVKSIGKV